MAMRSNENDLLSGGRQPGALHAVHELIAPWQTVSALAAETGQAVMRFTGVDASTDTHGRVEQSREQYNMIPEAHERLADSDEPGFVVDSAHVSELFGKPAKGSFISGQVDPAAVQAVINKVESKMVSTDAATQVVLRFNFMTGPESKVRHSCLRTLPQQAPSLVTFVHRGTELVVTLS
ncbi:hypothetical protein MMC08_000313 [Hypocenomyce scalaris]|nr:hypothetical protein [Hypocenomyce scalaris]